MRLDADVVLSGALLVVFTTMAAVAMLYPPDSRLLPLVVGIPGIALCATQLACAFAPRRARPSASRASSHREVVMLAWFAGFVVGVLLFGFQYGGPALVFAYLLLHQREKPLVAATAALVLLAFLHLVFERLLELTLFEGLIRA
jgi:uncharacterized membrane protein YfcA